MKIAILWQSMSGYFDACLHALADSPDVEICLAYRAAQPEAPFDSAYGAWVNPRYSWDNKPDVAKLNAMLKMFDPDAVLVSSWHINAYRASVSGLPKRTTRVLCMDNQWRGTPKQWLGRLTSRFYISPLFDIAFVPGDRQLAFANRLGFKASHVLRGLYCADTKRFTPPMAAAPSTEHAFLFVGRLVKLKGVSILVDAYQRYRTSSRQPWPLRIIGTGPMLPSVRDQPGIEYRGFVQPSDLPKQMWAATSLVLPSLFEPWGVVVHEAAIAGMIPICSDRVGAAVHLVQDGYNGLVVPAENPAELALAMERVARKSVSELTEMRRASQRLSEQFTTDRWARYLVEMLARPSLAS